MFGDEINFLERSIMKPSVRIESTIFWTEVRGGGPCHQRLKRNVMIPFRYEAAGSSVYDKLEGQDRPFGQKSIIDCSGYRVLSGNPHKSPTTFPQVA